MSSFGRFGKNRDHAVGEFTVCIKPLDGKGHARKRALTVKSWSTVKDLKDILQSLLHLPAASQRLFFRGGELRNKHTLQDCGIYRNGQTVYLAASPQDEMGKPYSLEPFIGAAPLPRSLSRVLGQARRGLDRGFKPELSLEGTGGTYFLQDAARQKVAVFKPHDEEPFAPNNPREAMQGGLGGGTVSMRPGIDAGESYVREVAAFLLDDRRIHGVPATTLVEAKHPAFCYWDHKERLKLGSFQEFVRHDMVVEDISPSRLSPLEVQKIALLDMRILNRDRNSVNILVRSRPRRSSTSFSDRARLGSGARRSRHSNSDGNINLTLAHSVANATTAASGSESRGGGAASSGGVGSPGAASLLEERSGGGGRGGTGGDRRARLLGGGTEYELVPIDHGLCLSDELVIDWCDWCWLDWRQVKEPIDPELCHYIQSFTPEATAENLGNTLNIREPCLRNLRIAETLLKEGCAAGLTLYDIACIIRREDFDKISELETVVARANELARAAVDHQTSVAPSKRTPNVNSKSLDTEKRHTRSPSIDSTSSSVVWASEDREGWALAAAQAGALNGRPEVSSPPPPPPPPPRSRTSFARESSTDASGEDLPFLSDVRASGSSLDSGGGGEDRDGGGSGPLRIWAPLSRESSGMPGAVAGVGRDMSSPTWSAESDTDLMSPVGFWHEKFETIDARNATRRFSGWGDNGSGEESSPDVGTNKGKCKSKVSSAMGWEGRGGDVARASRQDIVKPRPVREPKPPEPSAGGHDMVVGRKLFSSSEKSRSSGVSAKPVINSSLEPMEEGPESPYSVGGGPHPPPFWRTPIEPARDLVGGGGGGGGSSGGGARGGGDEKEAGGLGWRRGDAGLVVPEPRPPKTRSVTIQQVLPQRAASRIGDGQSGGGELKGSLSGPRPATTSPTLPQPGEHKSKMPKEIDGLSQGVKITRSYSYHGLGSMALYDYANRGTAGFSLKKRPNENSEQFKQCFFRFLRFLLRDLVKRKHRSIIKERGIQAARQAAEKSSKSKAQANAVAGASTVGGGGGDFEADDPLRRQAPLRPPSSSSSASTRPSASLPAAVRG